MRRNDHDPLCPMTLARYISGTGFTPTCQCDLIQAVAERVTMAAEAAAGLTDDALHVGYLNLALDAARADERERIAQGVRALQGAAPSSYWDDALDAVLDLIFGVTDE